MLIGAYHALPKTITRKDGNGAGAIVGFANQLLRLYEAEQPRAVIVGWDTLDIPTERHEKFAASIFATMTAAPIASAGRF